ILSLPCVAAAPPSLIDYALSRGLVDGVVVAGCSESACYNRLGVEWMQQRFAGERDPYLRPRVPRERILSVWASPTEGARLDREIDAFKARLAELPQQPSRQEAAEMPMAVGEAAS
ncbi:MAG: hydrogenase iron-sulfur subunit, partial [Xanthobacteraceae bacterium]